MTVVAPALLDAAVLADRLVEELGRVEPAYGDGRLVPRDDLWASCRDNLASIVAALANGGSDYAPAWETGRRRAGQGFPLDSLLKAYRLGGRVVWEALVDEARRTGQTHVDSLLDGATHVWDVIDSFSSAVAESYRRTQDEMARRHEQRVQAMLDALIDTAAPPPAVVRDAAAALGLAERGSYVVVVAAVEPGSPVLVECLREARCRFAHRVRADREAAVVEASSAAHLAAVVTGCGAAVGLSPCVDGLAHAGVAHRLAETALRTALHAADVAVLDQRLPAALVVQSPELGERLAHGVLGPVLRLPADQRRLLLESLDAFVAAGGSASVAASKLFCHRNTVLNRLRRLERLTGRSTARPADVVELVLAAHAVRLMETAPS